MCTAHAPFLTFRHRASQTQSRKLVIAKSAARDLIDGCSFSKRESHKSTHIQLCWWKVILDCLRLYSIESVRPINHSRPKISHFKRLLVCKSAYEPRWEMQSRGWDYETKTGFSVSTDGSQFKSWWADETNRMQQKVHLFALKNCLGISNKVSVCAVIWDNSWRRANFPLRQITQLLFYAIKWVLSCRRTRRECLFCGNLKRILLERVIGFVAIAQWDLSSERCLKRQKTHNKNRWAGGAGTF